MLHQYTSFKTVLKGIIMEKDINGTNLDTRLFFKDPMYFIRQVSQIEPMFDLQKHGGLLGIGDWSPRHDDATDGVFYVCKDHFFVVIHLNNNGSCHVETHEVHCLHQEITVALRQHSPAPADWSDINKIVLQRRGDKAGAVWSVPDFEQKVKYQFYDDGIGGITCLDGLCNPLCDCDIRLELNDGSNAVFKFDSRGILVESCGNAEPAA